MNGHHEYSRVRVRATVLPVLEQALGPGVAEALARTAGQLAADADALDSWAAAELARATHPTGDLEVASLLPLPTAVRTRALKAAALRSGVPAGAITAVHVHELDRLVVDWHGQGPVALPGSYSAFRDCDRLRFDHR
jgi:tRNA(Ile)-lysidine synthase